MKSKPLLLDLFSGAGGAAKGYAEAGFRVLGVDHQPQPRYPFRHVQADALEVLDRLVSGQRWQGYSLRSFAAIHASPPCQSAVKGLQAVNRARGRVCANVDLIPATRSLLLSTGRPFVIENVVGSTLLTPVTLCGTSFGLPLRRHRRFESSLILFGLPCAHGRFRAPRYHTSFQPHKEGQLSTVVQVYGRPGRGAMKDWPAAMGIDWMSNRELSQAIPPAYTLHLGRQLIAVLDQGA